MDRRGILRSVYRREPAEDRGRFDLMIELNDERFAAGDRLGLCSGIPLRPGAGSAAIEHEALATRLVLRPDPPRLIDGLRSWTISELEPLHAPSHANDGPVSAWIERADGSIIELVVAPAELDSPELNSVFTHAEYPQRFDDPLANLLPRPSSITSEGPTRRRVGVHVVNDPDASWPAVVALGHRLGIDLAAGDELVELDAAVDSTVAAGRYELEIGGSTARLRGGSPTAVIHGMMTLAQLVAFGMPFEVRVFDEPRHAHRGLSFDLARRWFEPAVVERIIDLAAWRKLSHLQLHLTDDEAWRVPVDAYPALAEIGGTRGHGLPIGPLCGSSAAAYGRAYTRAEIKRWVARADALAVELVPEIDIPGHCHAALIAVPELGDAGDTGGVLSVQGFSNNVLIPGPETTRFLHEVFGNLGDLFSSSTVLHVGGDEVPAGAWMHSPRATAYAREHGFEPGPALAGALIGEAVDAITSAGRGWAGWQEVGLFDELVEPAYVVAWKSTAAVGEALARGHRVVASPSDAYYLDMARDDGWVTPGASWAGSTPLTATCDFDLTAAGGEGGRLLGGQAAMWGEHIESLEVLDELLFPRLDAVAEATWTGDKAGRATEIRRRSLPHPTMLRQAASPAPGGSHG